MINDKQVILECIIQTIQLKPRQEHRTSTNAFRMETTGTKLKKPNTIQQDLQPTCSFWERAAASSVSCNTELTDQQAAERKQQPVKPADMFLWLTEEEAEMFLYLKSHNQHPIQFPLPVRTTGEPQLAAAPEEPRHTVAPKQTHQAAKLKALRARKGSNQQQQQTQVNMTELLQLQQLVGQTEDHITRLRAAQEAVLGEVSLLTEVKHLKEMLQTQAALNAELKHGVRIKLLQILIADRESTESKVKKLQEDLEKEKDRQRDVETSLARLWEENSRLMAALVQEEDDLETEILQWEEEESRHLKSTREQRALQQKNNRTVHLEQQMNIKKPEQQCLWKRFLQLFR